MKILTPKQLEREAAKLIREGRMPSLETLCKTILEVRKEYRLKILRTRREARQSKPVN